MFGDADAHAAQGDRASASFRAVNRTLDRSCCCRSAIQCSFGARRGRGKSRNRAVAEVIIAETGGDMNRFASAQHLASWPGVCPVDSTLRTLRESVTLLVGHNIRSGENARAVVIASPHGGVQPGGSQMSVPLAS
ncbi:transposase [Streptomyces sp. NPDC059697]|uniref:transposase n=1 Tax=Streptomyces sp. NPDC059697 TaxID=3346912 RepID=UPI0036BCD9E2